MKTQLLTLAFTLLTAVVFAQGRDNTGPKAKNQKAWDKPAAEAAVTSSTTDVAGPFYKNSRPGKSDSSATTQKVVTRKRTEMGPFYKNRKHTAQTSQ